MKMYICIKEGTPVGMAMNAAAHAGLICYKHFEQEPEMQEWYQKSFKKVTCSVTPAEFAMLKELKGVVVTESRLDNAELAIALCPVYNNAFPEFVNLLKLWK